MAEIDKAVISMLREVEHIAKDRKNTQQGYNFRGIDDVYNAVHPLLAKYGVYPTSKVKSIEYQERETQKGGTLFYARGQFIYTFWAEDGSFRETEALGEAMDSGDKASNKAMSNAYKYALFQLLCIPTIAVDGDQDTYEGIKERNGKQKPDQPSQNRVSPPPAAQKHWPNMDETERAQMLNNLMVKVGEFVDDPKKLADLFGTASRRELPADKLLWLIDNLQNGNKDPGLLSFLAKHKEQLIRP